MKNLLVSLLGLFNFFSHTHEYSIIKKHGRAEKSCVKMAKLEEYAPDKEHAKEKIIHPQKIPHNMPLHGAPLLITKTIEQSLISEQSILPSPPPTILFEALDDSLTIIPPDTQGTVGLNHVMTTLNDRIRIQTKDGITLRTVSLASFWGTTLIPYDPRLLYDPFNNRWIFVTLAGAESPDSMIMFAVSQTSDPTDGWNIYKIKADPNSQIWADFPSVGFNSKWIVIQTNMFDTATGNFVSSQIYAVDKSNVYAGGSGAFTEFIVSGFGATQTPALTYDNSLPTMYLLQDFNGNFNGNGYLLLYAINGPLGSETLTALGFIGVGSPWGSFPPLINGGFAPQFGTTARIDNNDSRMLSVNYRNGSLWAAQTVFLPASSPTHSAIQWWQINPSGAIQQFGRIEDPNATLNSGTFFAFPSLAVNTANAVLIGYSFFNPLIFASSGYSYRAANDPLNQVRSMSLLRNGLDIYTKDFGSGEVRWGDYSNTVVDPNGTNFWTIQESADTRTATGISRWVTWWGEVLPV